MTTLRSLPFLLALTLLPIIGCGRGSFAPSKPATAAAVTLTPDQQAQLAQTQQQLQQRASNLDTDNQQLEALLAQSRQETQLLRDQVAATQDQLRATADRLASTEKLNIDLRGQTEALAASVEQQAKVPAIQANNTLLTPLRVTNIPGVDVRQDGDVIRVSLPTDQLFVPGGAQLSPQGVATLQTVAANVLRNYPEQRIGIEGHTDGAPVASPQFPTSHHLSVAQATSIYEAMRRSSGAPATQLFVIGHGANHPLVSNGTEAGRQRNRRVELVVYPESVRRR